MENTNNATIEKEEAQLIPLLRLCLGQLKAHWVWFLFSVIACRGFTSDKPSYFLKIPTGVQLWAVKPAVA